MNSKDKNIKSWTFVSYVIRIINYQIHFIESPLKMWELLHL
ncbi:hypothetical protein LEP1GSC065_3139 [Leptospira kirschneri serovar Sokoine str. RM1]|nr:hypothetical protein LEP1GSC065_3139 [Leptospira kirschneri serovar Sokoine str. RM1]